MRARSLMVILAIAAVAACGDATGSPGVSADPAGASATPAESTVPISTAPAATTSPTVGSPSDSPPTEPPPTAAPIAITEVECLTGRTVRLHVHIDNDAGVVSYQLWSTWGGGGDTTRSFPTPYRTLVDETVEFTHAIVDPELGRIHQFGLAVTLAGASDPILTYQIEPGNRCPGH